jgi:hypothetical protein
MRGRKFRARRRRLRRYRRKVRRTRRRRRRRVRRSRRRRRRRVRRARRRRRRRVRRSRRRSRRRRCGRRLARFMSTTPEYADEDSKNVTVLSKKEQRALRREQRRAAKGRKLSFFRRHSGFKIVVNRHTKVVSVSVQSYSKALFSNVNKFFGKDRKMIEKCQKLQ